jgi:hypothetical protein
MSHRTVTRAFPLQKRPPRKRKPAAPLEGPAVITIRDKKRVIPASAVVLGPRNVSHRVTLPLATPASAIVTIRSRKPSMLAHLLDDMTPEEHKRRGDAADSMFQEMKRLIEAEVAKVRK